MSKKKLNGAASWFEIPAADLQRAKKFYELILEVEMQEMNVGNELRMALFPVESDSMGGAICEHKLFYRPGYEGPLVYLNGDPDLGLVLKRVEPAGGKIIRHKTQVSAEMGFMALFEDTEGNRIALLSNG